MKTNALHLLPAPLNTPSDYTGQCDRCRRLAQLWVDFAKQDTPGLCQDKKTMTRTYNAIARNKHLIGGQIRKARKAKGMTQKTLAVRIGVSQSDVSAIERGRPRPVLSVKRLGNIAGVLGCDFVIDGKTVAQ